jgi:hypothetical protein
MIDQGSLQSEILLQKSYSFKLMPDIPLSLKIMVREKSCPIEISIHYMDFKKK